MESLIIIFLLSITLHNLEEAIWLPAWSKQATRFHKPVGKNEFYFAVIVITLLAYLAAFIYIYFPNSDLAKYILIGLLGSMILNAIFPHLLATLVLKKYAPGLLTGILLNIPINSLILYRFLQSNQLTFKEIVVSTIIVGAILLSLIPALFKIGRDVTKQFKI